MRSEQGDIKIFAGSSGITFARKMCRYLGADIGRSEVIHFSDGNISSYDNVIHVWPNQKKVYDFFAETEWRVISLDTISWTDYGGKIKNEKYVVILQKG